MNPKAQLPYAKIHPCARVENTGTTEILTRALSSFSAEWNKTFGIFSQGKHFKVMVTMVTYELGLLNSGLNCELSFFYITGQPKGLYLIHGEYITDIATLTNREVDL